MSFNNNNDTYDLVHATAHAASYPETQPAVPARSPPLSFEEQWEAPIADTTPVTKIGSNDRSKRTQKHLDKKPSPPKKSQPEQGSVPPRIAQITAQAPLLVDSFKSNIDEQAKLDGLSSTNLKATTSHHCALSHSVVIHTAISIDRQCDPTVQGERLAQARTAIDQFCTENGVTSNGIISSVGTPSTAMRPAMELAPDAQNKFRIMGQIGDIVCGRVAGNPCCNDAVIVTDPTTKLAMISMLASYGIFIIAESKPFMATILGAKKEIVRCALGLARPLNHAWDAIVTNNMPLEPADAACSVKHASLFFYGMTGTPTRAQAWNMFNTMRGALEYQINKQKHASKKDADALSTYMAASFVVIRVKAFAVNRRQVRQFTFVTEEVRNLAERLCISTGQAIANQPIWGWKEMSRELQK